MGSMNLITTIIGFGMSATFIVFVCTRLICGRLRRIEAQQVLENDLRIDLELPEHQTRGLAPVVVAAIPTMKFNREAFGSTEDTQCTICLAEYQEKEVLRIMPKCGHSFHLSCIDIWLRKQSTCPVCRLTVTVQDNSVERKRNPRAALAAIRSFDSSEILSEHSRRWMLPTSTRAESNLSNTDSISIEMETGVSREPTSRSS